MKNVVVIGNGIAGISAALHIRRYSDYHITIISAESEHFYSRPALMYLYMGHLTAAHVKPYEDWFWQKNRLTLKLAYIESIDANRKTLLLQHNETMSYDTLIIASGSKSNMFGWEGQELEGVQGLYGLPDLHKMQRNTLNISRAVIVGGGLIGVEMAEMLLSRGIGVTFLVREKNYWDNVLPIEEAMMIERHLQSHGIDLRLETNLLKITADANGKAKLVITDKGEEIPCQFVGISTGVSPNVDFLRNSGIGLNKGVLVNEFLETNVPDIYAIGDCAELIKPSVGRKAIEPVWYTGRIMGETLAKTITGTRTVYEPGVWYNSAKFFNIEYQTYGFVSNQLQPGEQTCCWQEPKKEKLLRINYSEKERNVTGVNALGIRISQKVCEKWIKEKRSIDYAMEHLQDANFEPEFSKTYHREIKEHFSRSLLMEH